MTVSLDSVTSGIDASPGAGMVRLADAGHQAWSTGLHLEQPRYVHNLVNQRMQY